VSDAHTVVTRAWAGPHGITWNLGMRNVPEDSSPFLVVGGVKGGTVCRGWGNYRGVTELSFFSLSPAQPCPPLSKLSSSFSGSLCLSLPRPLSPSLCVSVSSPLSGSCVPLCLPSPHHPCVSGSLPSLLQLVLPLSLDLCCVAVYTIFSPTWGVPSLSPHPISLPSRLSLAHRSPEGKGTQGGSARSHRPGARPGDGGPSRCPSGGGGGRRVPAGAPGGSAWPESVGTAAVGAHAAFR
jgi:hypothetical protein